jgi:hypothetical protein
VRNASQALVAVFIVLLGCSSAKNPEPRTAGEAAMFAPAAMRVHPIFTRVKDFNGDNFPDGIDALLEFQDQFGDATKASGRAIFELYAFQKFDPTHKGKRLVNPWIGELESLDDQRLRWNRTSRTYSFPLQYDQVSATATYILTVEFQMSNGARYYDQIVLEPPQGAYAGKGQGAPTTSMSTTEPALPPLSAPATAPTSQP